MDYGNEFRTLRQLQGLSQEQLAKLTGISQQAISFWEQNKRTPNMDDCIKLADFYGITLDELVGRDYGRTAPKVTYNHSTHNGNNIF